jgi:hypothetical protein
VGKVLGTPHATGYPNYIILNHFFTRLFPIGSLAYKANLLSALFTVVACLFLFRILIIIFNLKPSLAFITALTFGLTPTLWSQSIVAEVYTLNILFFSIVVYFFLKWNKTRENRYFLIACAFYAFSFGNHMLMITALPGIIYFTFKTSVKTLGNKKNLAWIVLFITLGALQYSYLFWRFYYAPKTSFLEMQTPNLKRLWWYLTGAGFKQRMFSFSIAQIFSVRIPMFLKLLLKEYHFLIPVVLLGVFRLKNRAINIFFLLCFVSVVFCVINYRIPDIYVYPIPAYFIVAIYLGIGLEKIREWLIKKEKGLIFTMLFILIPLIMLSINFDKVNQHKNTRGAKKIERIVGVVNKDTIIVSPDYMDSHLFLYYLLGEGKQKNNIYVLQLYNKGAIRSYLKENKPLYIWEQRIHLPPGLRVLCMSKEHRDDLRKAGLKVFRVNNEDFYLVLP